MKRGLIKIQIIIIICLGLQSCSESSESLAEKACKCYEKAKQLNNNDGKLRQYEKCGYLLTSAMESLYEQSIEEDWARDEYNRKRDALSRKLETCE